jgi:uncharacterized membrane protein HdeD (DUF308 family)
MYLLGFAGLVTGVAALVDAFRGAGWGSGVYGGLNILLGLILLGNPFLAAIGVPWVYGTVAVVGGLFTIVSAFTGRGQTATA